MSNDDMGGLGGLANMLGGFQAKLEKLKEEAAAVQVTGTSGGGAVKVVATGDNQIVSITISDMAFDEKDVLEDLLRAATNEALRKAQAASAEKLSELTQSLPFPPGMIPGT